MTRTLARFHLLIGLVVASTPVVPVVAQSSLAASVSAPSVVSAGQGEAKIAPDRASVLVNVQTRASTASVAGVDNAQRTHSVLDALARLGLSREELSTEAYTVYPEMAYDKNGGSPRVNGYIVTNTVRAESKRPEQAGAIIDAALGAGATSINSLNFYASSIDEPRRQAIAIAVANARADAASMASAAGGSLGTLMELSTQAAFAPPRPMFDIAVRKVAQLETPIQVGQQIVTVSVNGRWAFVPAVR